MQLLYQIIEDTREAVPGLMSHRPYVVHQLMSPEAAKRMFYHVLSFYGRHQQATVYGADGKSSVIERQHRYTHAYNLMMLGDAAYELNRRMNDAVSDIAKAEYGVSVSPLHQAQVLGYEEHCVFRCHSDSGTPTDSGWKPASNGRDLTGILWLNDCVAVPLGVHQFSGGELELDNLRTLDGQRIIVAPTAGTLLVMPSHPVFRHSVAPITRGYRISLVNWWRVQQ